MSDKFGQALANMAIKNEKPSNFSGVVRQLHRVQQLDRFAKRLKELAIQAQDAVSIDSAMDSSSILVAVRLRPFLPHDKTYDTKETCLTIDGNNIDIEDVRVEEEGHRQSKSQRFKFDVFLPKTVTQSRVYVATAKRILVKVLKGYNGTIFTYGQTGSGKTHTMLGDEKDPGIIPRVGKDLIAEIKRLAGKTAFKVSASFVEIYREKISDLLANIDEVTAKKDQEAAQSNLSILKAVEKMKHGIDGKKEEKKKTSVTSFLREHFHDPNKKVKKKGEDLKVRESKHGVEILGVSMHPVTTEGDIMYLLDLGNESRHVASHALNATSSRSHVIFTLYIEQSKVSRSGQATRLKSKFNLIDLAGSERAERTGATGNLLKEGASINRSLSALGNVIKVLTDSSKKRGKKGKKHIPYRDSMLTRLLSDSLGGTASTLMCCNLAPGSDHYFETLSSLEFAKRVKKVKNTVTLRTEKLSQKEAKAMVNDAERLRKEMMEMKLKHERAIQNNQLSLSSNVQNELKLLRKQMEYQKKMHEALTKITKATATNDRSILSDEGQRTAKTITDAHKARLFFVDSDLHSISYMEDDQSEPSFEIGCGIIGNVAQTGEKMVVKMAPEHSMFDPAVDEASLNPTGVVGPLLAVPVIGQDGEVIGVLAVIRMPGDNPFSDDDVTLLISVCQHISHAVQSHGDKGAKETKLSLTALTVSQAGQKFHDVMMQIAALCETRAKMAALTEELIEDMIGGAHGTLFFVGGSEGHVEDLECVWSMHMKPSSATLVNTMPGIVGDCIRSHEIVNMATAEEHPEYHSEYDAHPLEITSAIMCVPVYKTAGEPKSGVIAAIRVMRTGAIGSFSKEDTAVVDLLVPYVSSGLKRIFKSESHMKSSLLAAKQLEEMTKRMEAVYKERDHQEQSALILQEEVRKRDAEMKQLTQDLKKKGLAKGARITLKRALEQKKVSQAEAMQASLTAELELMRQRHNRMQDEFENAQKELKKAEVGQKRLKMRHMSTKASQLLNAVDGKKHKKDLLIAKKQAEIVSNQLSKEREKTRRIQKAHELEMQKFRQKVKLQEEELRKKKLALEKSIQEVKEKHVKKLIELKTKLREFKSQANMQQDVVKVERNRRLSMALRSSFRDANENRLQETLLSMENELKKQTNHYKNNSNNRKKLMVIGDEEEEEEDDDDDDDDDDEYVLSQKKRENGLSMTLQMKRQPMPPKLKTMNRTTPAIASNIVSRHDKVLRKHANLSLAKKSKKVIQFCLLFLVDLNLC
jgi:hypothetical protein